MKAGYLYVLIHPSDAKLFKIGQTTLHPTKRLAQHNSNFSEYAGKIVKETGQKWELKTFIPVPDPHWAEAVFWRATPLADVPFLGGIEVQEMEIEWVEAGLKAAKSAGMRPEPEAADYVYANTEWVRRRLRGRDIALKSLVRSKYGKANFLCANGHDWRTTPTLVAEGAGCPECGIGRRTKEEVWSAIGAGTLCLLTCPERPSEVRIGVSAFPSEELHRETSWEEWRVHRYRNVDRPTLGETLFWEVLGKPAPSHGTPVEIDIAVAEQAFRDAYFLLLKQDAMDAKQSTEALQLNSVSRPRKR